jgi:hypothetical protein
MTDLSHEARVLLAVARRHDGPSQADRRRVAAALASAGVVGASLTGSAAAGVATGVGASAGAKLGAAGAAWGVAALGSKVVVPGLIGLALGAAVVAPVALRAPQAPEPSESALVVMAANTGGSGTAARPRPPPHHVAPEAPVLAQQAAASASPAAGAASSRRAVGGQAPPAPRSASLRDEADLLASVSNELGEGRSKRALDLLDDYERRYTSGALAEERAAARVFALCQAGQTPAARRHADEFLRTAPRSPLVPRIRSSCAFTEQKSSAGFEPVTEPPAPGHSNERRQGGAGQ